MAEVITREGTWTFDDEVLRIVPARGRRVHKLRQALGELEVPVEAIAGVAFERARKGGGLRLRLRDGADPFLHVVGGGLTDDGDPYRLAVERDAAGAAEYVVDEIRHVLRAEGVPAGPTDRFLLAAPTVPLSATAGDGTASFDGRRVRIEWTEWAEETKKAAGPQELALSDLTGVEWAPLAGLTNGFLRFLGGSAPPLPPKQDPRCITWGIIREGGTMPLLAAAVVARLPHPLAAAHEDPAPTTVEPAEHDEVLRRLREVGDLHRDGVLDADEFAAAKQALLRRL